MEVDYSVKNSRVNIKDLKKEIHPDHIVAFWVKFFKNKMVVTSGKDSTHSTHSEHYNGNAIDIRIWNFIGFNALPKTKAWQAQLEYACLCLAEELGPKYTLVLEKTHIHLQLTRNNIKNPSEGKGKHKNFFV